jgi:hypothetical protein
MQKRNLENLEFLQASRYIQFYNFLKPFKI